MTTVCHHNPTEGAAEYHEAEPKGSQRQAAAQQEPQQQQQQQQQPAAADIPRSAACHCCPTARCSCRCGANAASLAWLLSQCLVPARSAAEVRAPGGVGDVGQMLGPAGAFLDIIGRVALDKFAGFTEELRTQP